jgi:hypothetical protein
MAQKKHTAKCNASAHGNAKPMANPMKHTAKNRHTADWRASSPRQTQAHGKLSLNFSCTAHDKG